jgi:hypothetical protein
MVLLFIVGESDQGEPSTKAIETTEGGGSQLRFSAKLPPYIYLPLLQAVILLKYHYMIH